MKSRQFLRCDVMTTSYIVRRTPSSALDVKTSEEVGMVSLQTIIILEHLVV